MGWREVPGETRPLIDLHEQLGDLDAWQQRRDLVDQALGGIGCCGQSRIDPRADDGLTQAKSLQSQCWQRFVRLVHGSAESRHVGQKWIGANMGSFEETENLGTKSLEQILHG